MYKNQTANIQTAIIEYGAYAQLFKADNRMRKLSLLFPDGKTQTLSGQNLQELLDLSTNNQQRSERHDLKTGSPSHFSNTDWLLLNGLYLTIRPERLANGKTDLHLSIRSDKATTTLFEATEDAKGENALASLFTKTENWAQAVRATIYTEINLDDIMENGY